jgi:hypothetical protein
MKYIFIAISLSMGMAACTSKIDFNTAAGGGTVVTTDLLISEIATAINTDPNAGGQRNHYIEIFNGTAAAIDLSNYAIGYQASTDNTTLAAWNFPAGNFIQLTGTVAARSCYVIASPQADATAVPRNITWGTTSTTSANASSPLQLSGNSAIALLKKATTGVTINGITYAVIDAFGSPLVARETASGATSARNNFIWSVAGETDTRNRTFFRKKTVINPTIDWSTTKGTTVTNAQWTLSGDRAWDYTNVGLPTP